MKKNGTSQNGSYLQETGQPQKPSRSVVRMNSEPNSPPSQPSNLDILNMLQRLEASNKGLSGRVNRMEQNSTTSTPLQIRSREGNSDPTPIRREQTIPVSSDTRPDVIDSHPTSWRDIPLLGNFTSRGSALQLPPNIGRGQRDTSTEAFQRDAVLPNLNVLRGIPTVTGALNNIMASYASQARAQTSQGRNTSHKSGRYNATDIITAPPPPQNPGGQIKGTTDLVVGNVFYIMISRWPNGQWASCRIFII